MMMPEREAGDCLLARGISASISGHASRRSVSASAAFLVITTVNSGRSTVFTRDCSPLRGV
jgi:hypothetical protein